MDRAKNKEPSKEPDADRAIRTYIKGPFGVVDEFFEEGQEEAVTLFVEAHRVLKDRNLSQDARAYKSQLGKATADLEERDKQLVVMRGQVDFMQQSHEHLATLGKVVDVLAEANNQPASVRLVMPRHAMPRHCMPRHCMPRHAMPRHAIPRHNTTSCEFHVLP